MPFANLDLPSLALTQLKSVVDRQFEDQVSVDIHYLNHEFARYLGIEMSQLLVKSEAAHNAGVGDWFFRQAAFPELPENSEAYYRRFFPVKSQQVEMLKKIVQEKRRGLNDFMDGIISQYRLHEVDVVGFTSMFTQNVASFAMARKIKERNPRVITLIGGANCESPMGQEIAKNVRQIDFVFSGPGLKSLPEFVQHCLDQDLDQCHRIRGVFSLRNCGLSVLSQTALIGEELDINVPIDLDYCRFLEIHRKNFPISPVKPVLLFETSRGCWWGEKAHCTFCGLNGLSMNYRAMSPELAIRQFNSLFQYADRISRLECVDNIMPKHYLKEVFPHLYTPDQISIFYEVKADLSEGDFMELNKARIKVVQPGIEALNTSTLKLMRKGTSSFQNIAFLKLCSMYDVYPIWNLLVGFPGESEDVYKKYYADLPLLVHLHPPNGVYPVRFDRYSPYFVKAEEYQLDLHPVDYYEYIYPYDESVLSNLAYYFTARNRNADYVHAVGRWLGKLQARIADWTNRWSASAKIAPRLYFGEGDLATIYDSRSGNVVEHRVGRLGLDILEYLDRPKRLADLTARFGSREERDLGAELAKLQSKGLIFQEEDKYMSLVLLKEPPQTSFASGA